MPTYAYNCKKCGYIELLMPATTAESPKCPTCGGRIEKLCPQPGIAIHAYTTVYEPADDLFMGEWGSPVRKQAEERLKKGEIRPVSKKRFKEFLELTVDAIPKPKVNND